MVGSFIHATEMEIPSDTLCKDYVGYFSDGLEILPVEIKGNKKLPQWCLHDFVGQFNGLGPLFLILLIIFFFFWILPLGYFDQGRDQVTPNHELMEKKKTSFGD